MRTPRETLKKLALLGEGWKKGEEGKQAREEVAEGQENTGKNLYKPSISQAPADMSDTISLNSQPALAFHDYDKHFHLLYLAFINRENLPTFQSTANTYQVKR